MKKIFTLLAAAAVTVPMMTAAEKTVTAELGYKFDSYGTTYSKVAELANQKITYDETEKAYTLVNFLGWEGANLTFKLSETTFTVTENEIPVIKYPMIIAFEGGDATVSTDSYKFLPDNEKIVSKKHRRFHVNTTENSAVFTGVLDEKGETNDYRLSGDTYFGCLTELSLSKATTTLASNCLSYAVIDENNNIKLIIGGGNAKGDIWGMTVQKVPAGGDWNSYTKTYATSTAVMYTFPAELKGGDPEPVEPEGNTTIDLYAAETTLWGQLEKYGNKMASQPANVSYDENTKQYTVADFLGYKNANLIFSVIEDKTFQLDGKDVNPIRVQLPESSEQEGEFTEWSNIVIEGNTASMFTFKLSNDNISMDNVSDEYWRSAAFIGSDKDYKYINPMFWAVTTNSSADITESQAIKACVEKQADGSSIVRIQAYTQTLVEKAKDAAEWPQDCSYTRTGVWFTIPADLNAGIEGVETDVVDEDAPVEYYNLQGVKVENPAAGLYIKRQGKKVEKVVIR